MEKPVKILHLEDDDADAELVRARLISDGIDCEIMRVDNRADFLSALKEPRFDLILADYSLPGFDGLSALKITLENCPDVPYIFLSGTMGEEIAVESLKSGATDYVLKDRLSRLAPAVLRALREAEDRAERVANLKFFECMDKVNRAIQGARDVDSMMSEVLKEVLSAFDCDRAWLFYPCDPDAASFRVPMEITKPEYPGAKALNVDVPMPPDMARNLREALESAAPVTYTAGTEKPINKVSAEQFGVKSQMMAALYPKLGKPWVFGLHQCSYPRAWTPEDERLMQEIGWRLSDGLTVMLSRHDLQKSERKFRAIFDQTFQFIGLMTVDGVLIEANKSAMQFSGVKESEALGKPFWETPWWAHSPALQDHLKEAVKKAGEGEFIRFEATHPGADGILHYVDFSLKPVKDETGKVVLLIPEGRDITDRKRAEDALRNEAAITGALLEAANVASRDLVWEDVVGNVAGLVHELTASKGVFVFQLVSDGLLLPQFAVGLSSDALRHFNALRVRVEDIKGFRDALNQKMTLIMKRGELQDFGLAGYSGQMGLMDLVVVPITARDKAVGIMCVNFDSMSHDPRVVTILEGIARQLGVSYDNSRLYLEIQNKSIELERSLETMKVLSDIDRRILSTLNRDEVMSGSISQIRRIVPADIAGILLLDEDSDSLVFSYGWSLDMKAGDTVSSDRCSGYPTIRTGRTLVRKNLDEETGLSDSDITLLEKGIKSDIYVPIICKEKGIGLLHIGSYRVAGFSLEDVRIIESLAAQLGIALTNANLLSDLEDMFINVVTAFASAIDAKSPWTNGHSERVTKYAMQIAEKMGMAQSEIDRLKLAGLMHDIGKIGTYDIILDKPGKLTDEEFALIKKHPDAGANILKPIKQFKDIIPAIRHHHERWDGEGYPGGLEGAEIPFLARILCVADSYDSMTADRPYRTSPGLNMPYRNSGAARGHSSTLK